MTTAWRAATGVGLLIALALGISVLPPFFREIALTLAKAIAIAVAAYIVFVALNMRGNG